MITVEEALQRIESQMGPLPSLQVPLEDALGLVLAEEVVSSVSSPPYDKSMMDGYAVISSDREPQRKVLENVMAGDVPHAAVTPGTAMRIMTGAPLPEGADAVVPLERIEHINERTIRIPDVPPSPGQHILRFGTCIKEGQIALHKGHVLRAAEIGLLAEIGHYRVHVIGRPSVAIISTGSELVDTSEKLRVGQIRNSNGPMLTAAVRDLGGAAEAMGIGRDDSSVLSKLIEQGLRHDVLLISGGISAGDRDLVPGVLEKLGVEQIFHQVSVKPGKPVWFGVAPMRDGDSRRKFVFGLPGNPVSSFVCFQLFVRPALAALAGRGFVGMRRLSGCLSHRYENKGGGRTTFAPAKCDNREQTLTEDSPPTAQQIRVELLPWKGSADLIAFAKADALVELPAEGGTLEAGSRVKVHLL
jgi:molybdopterin molybdotransferase